MADCGSAGLPEKNFTLFRLEIRSATQATQYEDNSPAAEDHDAYKTLNGGNFPPPDVHQCFATPRSSTTPCYVLIQLPTVIEMIYDGLSKPSILHLPTSFFKQILTPSRFTVVAVAVRWCFLKNANFTLYHFMVLWFNDAIFNLKCKTKGN